MIRNAFLYRFILAAGLVLAINSEGHGQTDNSSSPWKFGGFENRGGITAGYRFTDVKGYEPQFHYMFGLQTGFRVFDVSLHGQSSNKSESFLDKYDFTATGIGGDPFSTAQIGISKTRVFELNINWRQSRYYWNQNDAVALPITSIAPAFTSGLTTNHDWETVRRMASAELSVHATPNLQFSFETGHDSNDGTPFTTRTIDFLDSPAFWGSFARANPYYLVAPAKDSTNRVVGGVDYIFRKWSFHNRIGYLTFDGDLTLNSLIPNQLSIDPVALSQTEPLANLSWSQTRRMTAPGDEFSFSGNLTPRLRWRGGYTYYRYSGPAASDEAENGIAPGSTGALAPYTITESGRTENQQSNQMATQGFSYAIRPWWDADVDYRYSRYSSNSTGTFQSLFNGTTSNMSIQNAEWKDGLNELKVQLTFHPIPTLLLSPGVHLFKSDILALENGVADPARTQRSNVAQPEFSFSYRPISELTIRGDVQHSISGASYTAITPHTQTRNRLIVRYQPIPSVSVEDSMIISNSALLETNYSSKIRTNAVTVSYSRNEQFSTFGGMTYDSSFTTGDIVYPRGPAPLNTTFRDQDINRVWQAGLEVKPTHRSGIQLQGNYERTTGVGQIIGEPPAYGPLTWPIFSGTAYYTFPKAGRLSIDLQRSYYIEELVTVNNFSANMLTIRWTHGF